MIGGVMAAGIAVFTVESIGHALFPPSTPLDVADSEALAAALTDGTLPLGALVSVVLGWLVGCVAGGFVAAWIGQEQPVRLGATVGTVQWLFIVMNLVTIPHPMWMGVVGVILAVPAGALGGWLGARTDPDRATGT